MSSPKYRTIGRAGSAEIVIEKSRFIAYLRPVRTREEAGIFFDEIRRRHHDARHHVPCFVIGDAMQEKWSSEDGEPQGTAGAPMLQLLVSEGVTNAAAIVTRYFGGIKLGTGGLVRAYTAALKSAIEDAGIVDVWAGIEIRYRMSYAAFEKMKAVAARDGYIVSGAEYEDAVTFTISGSAECEETLRLAASSAAGADAEPISVRTTEIFR
ncbi:MAG: YigZ family protein [Clostridiales Family XIII bacterium]|nr:YigZ family protein [Clostridiales Family XIII bacterium]